MIKKETIDFINDHRDLISGQHENPELFYGYFATYAKYEKGENAALQLVIIEQNEYIRIEIGAADYSIVMPVNRMSLHVANLIAVCAARGDLSFINLDYPGLNIDCV